MRCFAFAGGLMAVLVSWHPERKPEPEATPILRQHFVGLDAIVASPDLVPVASILAMPETRELLRNASARIAENVPGWWEAPPSVTNHTEALRTMVSEFLRAESIVEVRARGDRVSGWAVAARLGIERAGEWGRELAVRLPEVLGVPAVPEADSNGAWKIEGDTAKRLRFASVGDWVLVGGGTGAWETVKDRLASGTGLEGDGAAPLLRCEADPERWSRILGWGEARLGPVDRWPRRIELAVEPRSGRLRTEARLDFDEPIEVSPEPWRVPADLLRDPLVGFTAMQGADRWLGKLAALSGLGIDDWPERLFLWSIAGYPWLQYFAAETGNPTNLLAQLMPALPLKLMTNSTWQGQTFGLRVTNRASRVQVMGLAYLEPFVEALPSSEPPLLVGGLFPANTHGDPAPPELLRQVAGRTNLLMYDWEVTGLQWIETNRTATARVQVVTHRIGRLVQLKELTQLGIVLRYAPSQWPQSPTGFIRIPGGDWVDAVGPALGDTVTELTLEDPRRVALTRQSRLGLSAIELIYLLRWMENPGFPGWREPTLPPPGARKGESTSPTSGVATPSNP